MYNATVNRISRIAFGSVLIVTTLSINSTPLGGFAVLPLIAIPLILSGIYGENPLGELADKPVTKIKTRIERYIAKVINRTRLPA